MLLDLFNAVQNMSAVLVAPDARSFFRDFRNHHLLDFALRNFESFLNNKIRELIRDKVDKFTGLKNFHSKSTDLFVSAHNKALFDHIAE